jgi:hypothetical protein
MTTSSSRSAAIAPAFTSLIDYAGLFPPAELPMSPALDGYGQARSGPFAWMLGRFIVPATRIDEMLASRTGAAPPLPLSVIVNAERDPRSWFGSARALLARVADFRSNATHVAIEALEVPLPALPTRRETYDAAIGQLAMLVQQTGLRDLPCYLEMPRDARYLELLPGAAFALARHGLRAKIRCGGAEPQAVPSPQEVAHFLIATVAEGVAFKATAGLHHPVARIDPETGFAAHGFLNVLCGAVFARAGADLEDLERIVAESDPHAFEFDANGMRCGERRTSVEDVGRARRESFVAYGSCSFSEPVDDLVELGVL